MRLKAILITMNFVQGVSQHEIVRRKLVTSRLIEIIN